MYRYFIANTYTTSDISAPPPKSEQHYGNHSQTMPCGCTVLCYTILSETVPNSDRGKSMQFAAGEPVCPKTKVLIETPVPCPAGMLSDALPGDSQAT
jgi:hypothetical protein